MTVAQFARLSAFCSLCLVLPAAACNIIFTPPPEAVLEGAWALTTTRDFGFDARNMTFDGSGHLTEVEFVVGIATFSKSDLQRSTSVDGSHVRIATTDDFVYDGNFNADHTVITGKLSTVTTSFGTTISVDRGGFTLTKK